MQVQSAPHGNAAWCDALRRIARYGHQVAPRGQSTLEIMHINHVQTDLYRPVVTSTTRKLNYRFMAAEALWILSGDNRLAPLQRFIKNYDRFSDDGVTLAGAYGPKVVDQLEYVVNALLNDRDTRQAVLTIWERNPAPSKDIPCTVAMSFSIRHGYLQQHVFMRSSDAWLGVPYDMFSFAMVAAKVACWYNLDAPVKGHEPVRLGCQTITATSSHLYERDLAKVQAVLDEPTIEGGVPPIPDELVLAGDWAAIEDSLVAVRENLPLTKWMWHLNRKDVTDGK